MTIDILEREAASTASVTLQTWRPLGIWVAVVAIGSVWGAWLNVQWVNIVLFAPPLLAHLRTGATLWVLVPIACAPLLVAIVPVAAERLAWRALLPASVAASVTWSVALALADGRGGLTHGLTDHTDYLHDVPRVRGHTAAFLHSFVHDIARYEIQVRGHPPGMVLLLSGMAALGLRAPGWEAALVIGAAASATAAVLIAVRELAGETMARRAMPWLVIAPAAIFIASSADALYMALSAWSITLVIVATGRRGRVSRTTAVAGGMVGGLALMGSYGAVLAALPALVVAWRRSRAGCIALAALGSLSVLLAFERYGFWWPDGLRATLHQYQTLPITRPYPYFLLNDLSAWALALGPAMAVAIARLRDPRIWLLVGGALAAAAIADVSGFSRGEVERIWLPFTIWIFVAGISLTTTRRATRAWLSVQAVSAIAIVALLKTQW